VFSKEKIIKEFKSLFVIVFVVLALRSSLFEPFHIPTGSMIPNLFIGDFVLINKFSYGFKVPFTDYRFPFVGFFEKPIYLTKFSPPKRGDIFVFRYPNNPDISFIKRVIGLPGDEIEIINKQIYLNGQPLKSEALNDAQVDPYFDRDFRGEKLRFYQSKIDDREFVYQTTDRVLPHDDIPRFKVPEGQYFSVGDNRDFSMDSRYWGFVPEDAIRGKAMLVWFSFMSPILDEVGPSDYRFQWYRIGKTLW